MYLSVENITFKSHGVKRNSTRAVQQTRLASRKTFERVIQHSALSVSISDDDDDETDL